MTTASGRPRIATYRVQLTPAFGFAETIGILDHLESLGVSHLYLSPIAEAVPGSVHGYDVVDHRAVRAELGGRAGLFELLDAAHARGLGVIVDHVPNHVSVAEPHRNEQWWTMLRDGPTSPAAAWFDVDWVGGDGGVIVPRLGAPLDDVIAAGDLEIGEGDLGPELRYGRLRFPLAPGTEHLAIDAAVDAQHYRLQWWRDPARNVRRFFTVDDLVAVRVEDATVADVVDTIPALLADHPAFAGVRVDHVDGLARPARYLEGLRRRIGDARWLLVEKIPAADETLPPSWPVDGTTGYEHIRITEHTFLDPAAEPTLTRLWSDLTGDERPFAAIEDEARREVLAGSLRPDLDRVVRAVATHVGVDSVELLSDAVVELTVGLHRYRTYLPDDPASVAELVAAHDRARRSRPDLAEELESLVALLRRDAAIAARWEQLTSPVMAKGAEDRAFYRYLRLAALCEVGGAPGDFTLSSAAFHRHQSHVQATMPMTLLAGTTHDTKRSEGVRARALAMTAIAERWAAAVRTWFEEHHEILRDARLDAATTVLALETAVSAWPIDAERLTEYLVKSAREADLRTSWTDPDDTYERALAGLAELVVDELGDGGSPSGSIASIVGQTLRPGWAASLAALTLRLTVPGVPDLYQGTVAFTYSLVDPDNRVEPDWDERRELVALANVLDGPTAWRGDDVEASKAVVVRRALALRRRRSGAFGPSATYEPLSVSGIHVDRVVAFARGDGTETLVVTVVSTRAPDGWADTVVSLPPGRWHNVFVDDARVIGEDVAVGELLGAFPVALLERADL